MIYLSQSFIAVRRNIWTVDFTQLILSEGATAEPIDTEANALGQLIGRTINHGAITPTDSDTQS